MTFLQFLAVIGCAILLVSPIFLFPHLMGEPDAAPSVHEAAIKISACIRVTFYALCALIATIGVIGFLAGNPIFLVLVLLFLVLPSSMK